MLGIAFTVNSVFAKDYSKGAGVNFGVEVTSEPMDGLKLKAGFDGGMALADTSIWDAISTAEYKWVSGGVYLYSPNMSKGLLTGNPSNPYDFYTLNGFSMKDLDASYRPKGITDFAFFLQFATKADKKDASNLVEGLDAGAHLAIYQLNTFLNKGEAKIQFPLLFKVWGAYQLNLNDSSWLEPFANVWGETNHGLGDNDPEFALAYSLGLTYSPIEKVEVTAEWSHGVIQNNYYRSAIETPAGFGKYGYHNGQFVLSLKLTY